MPCPFPGMDPYLEHPLLWPSFQQYFIGTLADLLGEVLPRRFQAQLKERIFYEIGPTVLPAPEPVAPICILPPANPRLNFVNPAPDAFPPVWHIPTAPEENRETFLEIHLGGEANSLRTVIEFLTPANKMFQSVSREHYLTHRQALLTVGTHLLEIDLLRGGEHTVLAPRQRLLRRGRYDYLACLSRATGRDFCEVWGMSLREPLPRLVVPLVEEPDLVLDLQALVTRCYEEGGFARQVDYGHDPFYPLSRADARWAESLLEQVS